MLPSSIACNLVLNSAIVVNDTTSLLSTNTVSKINKTCKACHIFYCTSHNILCILYTLFTLFNANPISAVLARLLPILLLERKPPTPFTIDPNPSRKLIYLLQNQTIIFEACYIIKTFVCTIKFLHTIWISSTSSNFICKHIYIA